MTERQKRLLNKLKNEPVALARALGFDLLGDIHNEWIKDMVFGHGDKTLQAHRGSYKTTCVSVALYMIIILYPNTTTVFLRKTDNDCKEVIAQVYKLLEKPLTMQIVQELWNTDLMVTKHNANEITTNLSGSIRGASQLTAIGIGGSVTGKHYDRIFTDDIVNLQDRISKADRDRTKLTYMELQSIKNRGGRIYNTGTPWHKEDCFSIMPEPEKYDCYSTGLISELELENIRQSMTASLFAANYELKHIADDNVLFTYPKLHADPSLVEQARFCHVDAAYGGEDYTAFTIVNKRDGKYYVFGKLWRKHVDDVMGEMLSYYQSFMAGKILMETNGDKGYLAKEIKKRGARVGAYHENMNKHLKITTYLKGAWKDIVFVEGTDGEYIEQICDYTEEAAHDDAPDSLACLIRRLWNKNDSY